MPDKAEYFRSLHQAPPVLVLPNAWDAATARVFEAAGFRAVATTSAGVAAAETFIANLKRFAAAQGKPERYHETISLAYLLLIHDRIVTRGRGATWSDFAEANPDLLAWQPSILDRYYSRDLLDSDLARRTFVGPDWGSDSSLTPV